VLVTVPLHLRAAQTIPPGGLRGLHAVFSSTAPLSGSTAEQFSQTHEIGITEVFGSTETGGIAWRRTTERELWRALPGVVLGTDAGDALTVDSPFLGAEVARPYVTADRVELHSNQSFSHRGRTDGVVKVGGRRVSLPSMEEWLLQRPGLQDCAVISAEQGERGARVLAAIVAPDWTEQQQRALRGQMSERFEPSTLPKRLLYLDRLPREENGKLPRYRVLEAFGLGADGQPLVREMLVRSCETDAAAGAEPTQIRARVCVPENHLAFAGHFASYAVLPGAAQLQHLVAEIAVKHRPRLLAIRRLLHVKFTARIAPGDEVLVELRFSSSAPECDFTIRQGDIQCASGRVSFFEAPREAASRMEEAPES
jgi:3-hydroxymyristoyl/3-hydroxydecanoyl-(acyl carrier protein) dehydratase